MEEKSKTQRKKEAHALQELGRKLVKLSREQLKDMGLPEEVHDAVVCAKTMKSHGALKRQMQYIGALMRQIDPAPVQEALHNIESGNRRRAGEFKETEQWRDALIAGDRVLMEDILETCRDADRQHLAHLVRQARKEADGGKPPGASRALFRYLQRIRNRQG